MIRKITAFLVIFCLVFEQSGFAQVAPPINIPAYLAGYLSADRFRPVHLRSISFDPLSSNVNLLLDKGDAKKLRSSQLEETTRALFEYFQIGLNLPNSMFWVNLRPDDSSNIIDPYLEKTDLGKVLLEADLQLKKDMAACTSPDTKEGRVYWNKLYAKAESLFGQSDMEIPTITRPWIVPGEIIMAQSQDSAYVYKATLKVMLEQDYLKDAPQYNSNDPRFRELNDYSSQVIRSEILPKLTRQVNSAKQYAGLRQVYYSLILAQWYKQKTGANKTAGDLSSSVRAQIDTRDLTGLTSDKPWSKQTYYQAYRRSFEKGEYNKEETVPAAQGLTIRRYFSGGIRASINPGTIMVLPINQIIGNQLKSADVVIDTETGAIRVNPAALQTRPEVEVPAAQTVRDGGRTAAQGIRSLKRGIAGARDYLVRSYQRARTVRAIESIIIKNTGLDEQIYLTKAQLMQQLAARGIKANEYEVFTLIPDDLKKNYIRYTKYVTLPIPLVATPAILGYVMFHSGLLFPAAVSFAVSAFLAYSWFRIWEESNIAHDIRKILDGISFDSSRALSAGVQKAKPGLFAGAVINVRTKIANYVRKVKNEREQRRIEYNTPRARAIRAFVYDIQHSSGELTAETIRALSAQHGLLRGNVPAPDAWHAVVAASSGILLFGRLRTYKASGIIFKMYSDDIDWEWVRERAARGRDGGEESQPVRDEIEAYLRWVLKYHDFSSPVVIYVNDVLKSSEAAVARVSQDPLLVPQREKIIETMVSHAVATLVDLTRDLGRAEAEAYLRFIIVSPDFTSHDKKVCSAALDRIADDGGVTRDGGKPSPAAPEERVRALQAFIRAEFSHYVDYVNSVRSDESRDQVMRAIVHDQYYLLDFYDQINTNLTLKHDVIKTQRLGADRWQMQTADGDIFVVIFNIYVPGEIDVFSLGAAGETASGSVRRDGGNNDNAPLDLLERLLKPMLFRHNIKQLDNGFHEAEKAAKELGRLGDNRAVDPLLRYIKRNLERDHAAYNRIAEESLRRLGVDNSAIEGVYIELLSHRTWYVRTQAAEWLQDYGSAAGLEALRTERENLLNAPNNVMDHWVCKVLDKTIAELSERLGFPAVSGERAAADGQARDGGTNRRGFAQIVDRLSANGLQERRKEIEALIMRGDVIALIEALTIEMKDDNGRICGEIATALGDLGDPAALDILAELAYANLLSSDASFAKNEAQAAISRIKDAAKDGGVSDEYLRMMRVARVLKRGAELLAAEPGEAFEIRRLTALALAEMGDAVLPDLRRYNTNDLSEEQKAMLSDAIGLLESASGSEVTALDAQAPVGGIDLRALPVNGQVPSVLSAVVRGADIPQATAQELDEQWEFIEKSIASGPMPYEKIKAHAIACCQNKEALGQRTRISAYIGNLLKLEELAAVETAPELKEILVAIS